MTHSGRERVPIDVELRVRAVDAVETRRGGHVVAQREGVLPRHIDEASQKAGESAVSCAAGGCSWMCSVSKA
jgi:hypothetical protein